MDSQLFQPIKLRGLELTNRIVVSPMCQYSATDGTASDWHIMHLGQYAVSGVGLVLTEATGVVPEGRISPNCLGLYSDENEEALKRVITFTREFGNSPIGVQLAHAGRKACTEPPWQGQSAVQPEDGGWEVVAPSRRSIFQPLIDAKGDGQAGHRARPGRVRAGDQARRTSRL